MKELFTLLGITCFSLLVSCSKDSAVNYPVEMAFDRIETITPMQVFTNGGSAIDPVTHAQTISDFLNEQYSEKTETGRTYYISKFNEPKNSDYQQHGFYFYGNGKVKYAVDIIAEKQYDDATVMVSSVTNAVKDDPIVESGLFKYPYDIDSKRRYNYQYVVHKKTSHSIEVALLYYKLVRYDDEGNRTQLAWGRVHNEWNESFVQTLKKRDTLAVKTYRLKYSVKK